MRRSFSYKLRDIEMGAVSGPDRIHSGCMLGYSCKTRKMSWVDQHKLAQCMRSGKLPQSSCCACVIKGQNFPTKLLFSQTTRKDKWQHWQFGTFLRAWQRIAFWETIYYPLIFMKTFLTFVCVHFTQSSSSVHFRQPTLPKKLSACSALSIL